MIDYGMEPQAALNAPRFSIEGVDSAYGPACVEHSQYASPDCSLLCAAPSCCCCTDSCLHWLDSLQHSYSLLFMKRMRARLSAKACAILPQSLDPSGNLGHGPWWTIMTHGACMRVKCTYKGLLSQHVCAVLPLRRVSARKLLQNLRSVDTK